MAKWIKEYWPSIAARLKSLKERDEREEWLGARKSEHLARTSAIVGLETELNARVYALFGLLRDEVALIETSTKYAYGEV